MERIDLRVFAEEFHDEIRANALVIEALREEIFLEKMGEILEDYGEVEALVPCMYKGHGLKVDGYHYDDEFKDFTLVVSYFLDERNPERAKVTRTDLKNTFRKAENFLRKSLKGLHQSIEVSNEAHELATLIYECRNEIRNVKVVLVTDGVAPKGPAEIETLDGIEFLRTVWDIDRTCTFYRTGERERIAIDFSEYCGGPLPSVIRSDETGAYTTYLAFVPGSALADMYARWGIKMLDMNVRVFLSARGNVNKGILLTIRQEPEMFCAYNNGITVFARDVETSRGETAIGLVGAHDFQIVNGGQTTASLYHARQKYGVDLAKIFVQMKLTVIHDESRIADLVPRISEFSNTQNRVQLADLAANEAPHPEIQAISNQIAAPDPTGGSRQTYWFYERSRGSYEEMRNLTARTPAQKKQFDAMRPKNQKFDKIKFGKVWNTYLRLPHVVSLGAQKNFGRFNQWVREQGQEDWVAFFRKTVALLILWNEMERIVRRQKYQGYHHNIVAYTLAWFFDLTDMRVDLEKIWAAQAPTERILDVLEELSHIVNGHIRQTKGNVTEFSKKEECWVQLRKRTYVLPSELSEEYICSKNKPDYHSGLVSEQAAVKFCKSKGGDAWLALSKWLKERDFLSPKARSQCYNMGRTLMKGEKEPSVALSIPCMKIWNDAEIRGWAYSPDPDRLI